MGLKNVILCIVLIFLSAGQAQIIVPDFGSRGDIPAQLRSDLMLTLRSEIGRQTGLEVRGTELITQGIASSLVPDLTISIAELEGGRYALSGEIRQLDPLLYNAPYAVSVLIVDAQDTRSSDIITIPFSFGTLIVAVTEIASQVKRFTEDIPALKAGDASLFITSQPAEATVLVNGIEVGRTAQLEVLELDAGNYTIELRKDGYLPTSRRIELRDGLLESVHIIMTPIAGGSIQINSRPVAEVLFEDETRGFTPLTLSALPGTRSIRLERQGFESLTLEVSVRDYRVTRIDPQLRPLHSSMLFWDSQAGQLIFIDGTLQTRTFLPDLRPGNYQVDVREAGQQRSFNLSVPAEGVYYLDLQLGQLQRY